MKLEDFKFLWSRDKAHQLRKPSIDRINNDGNYIIKNCRFIELRENQRRINTDHSGWKRHISCKDCSKNNRRHYAHGLCILCYKNRLYAKSRNLQTKSSGACRAPRSADKFENNRMINSLIKTGWNMTEQHAKELEDFLHKCLDPYLPPIVADSNQSLKILAKTIDTYYRSHPPKQGECKKCKELECVLDAWHTAFGTTQLTHALDRLQVAENKQGVELDDIYELLCNKRLIQNDDGKIVIPFKQYNEYLWELSKAIFAKFAQPTIQIKFPEKYDIYKMKHGAVVQNTWREEGWNAAIDEFKRINKGE